ncbi:MAG: hypothetical protein LBC61_00060 [Candidatus Peribacteria bacterium]|jgi:hypothetical protein|nr:hypothetical protein [Candidatus Peribacteria bacterium]
MQNRNTNTGNQLKDALNEVLNLYDNIKEKNPETKNSIYKYYGEEKCIKKGMLENKIPMGFHRKNMSISFAKYLDDSYLFPRSNQL